MTSSDIDLVSENENSVGSHKTSMSTVKMNHPTRDLFRTDFVAYCPGNCYTLPTSHLRELTQCVSDDIRSSKLSNFATMRPLINRNLSFRSSLKLDIAEYQVHVNVQIESSTGDLEDELRVSTLPLAKQKKSLNCKKSSPLNRSTPGRKLSESEVPLRREERGRHVKSHIDTRVQKVWHLR